jgi:iron complex outermembrane recepter protein
MSSKRFKKSLLAVSIMALSVPSFAQTDKATDENMEEVVVTGMRNSIATAQDLKRNADTVVDAITASDIGALPDKSVTEALQRVAGVTIERFAASEDPNHFTDEGTGVLVRGLDRVRSEVNGRSSFSANPYSGLNFEDISPELLGAVEVYKNQTASMISGGIAGTVNLVTRKPFDSDGRVIGATVKGNYGDFREDFTPSFSGIFSDRWETDAGEFGFLVSASSSEYHTRGDGVGVANFYSRGAGEGLDGAALNGQTQDAVWMPGQFSIRTAENDREREGYSAALQWKNTDGTVELTLEHLNSEASLEWNERVIGSQEQGFKVGNMTLVNVSNQNVTAEFDNNGFFQYGEVVPSADLPYLYSTRYNLNKNTIDDTAFNVTLRPNDRLKVELDYQKIDSSQHVENNGINATYSYLSNNALLDLRGGRPTVEFLDEKAGTGADVLEWGCCQRGGAWLNSALDQNSDSDAEADSYALDVEYEIDSGWLRSVKAGAYYTDKDLVIRDTEYANWGALNFGWVDDHRNASKPSNPVAASEWESVDFSDFYKGGVLLGDVQSFMMPKSYNAKNFTEFTRRICENGVGNGEFGGGAYPQTNPDCFQAQADLAGRVNGSVYAPHQITSTNEERTEAYVQFNFGNDELAIPVRGNVGFRYVNYKLSSSGFTVLPVGPTGEEGAAALFAQKYPNLVDFTYVPQDSGAYIANGQFDSVDGTDYSKVLPSLNVAFNLTDEMVLRFGLSESLYYPTMDQTRNSRQLSIAYDTVGLDPSKPVQSNSSLPNYNPIADFTDVGLNGVARNSYLEPEESLNMDVSFEWYFSKTNSLTVSLFNKEIDNLFRERSFQADVTNQFNGATETVSFVGPANEGSGSIRGIELSYTQFFDMLPGAWSGLGVQANYTYVDQQDLNDKSSDDNVNTARFDSAGNLIQDTRNQFRSFSNLPLPGYSENNFNLVGMYEYNDVSFRLAYNWRSEYLVTRRDSNEFAPIFAKAAGYLDASLSYNINENFKVGFEASNLLDTETETMAQYNQAGDKTDALNFITDKRYAVFVRMNF